MKQNKKILFLVIFVLLGIIFLQIPIYNIVGSSSKFTLFDMFYPITGSFLGSTIGAVSVFFVEVINFLIKKMPLDLATFVRFWPAIAAAFYFGSKSRYKNIISIVCIGLFLAHPIGRQAWYYPLAFWFIPVITSFFKDKLIARSLGTTFTAHAVGSTLFLYAFNLPVNVWKSLMTIVPLERLYFAFGIVVSYIVINNVIHYLSEKTSLFANLADKKALLNKKLLSNL